MVNVKTLNTLVSNARRQHNAKNGTKYPVSAFTAVVGKNGSVTVYRGAAVTATYNL